MGILTCFFLFSLIFSAIVTKNFNFCDFLFASLEDEAVQKFGQLLKERICSYESKFFPLRVDPNREGWQNMAELLPL